MPVTTRNRRTTQTRRGPRFRREQPSQSRMDKLRDALPSRNKSAKRNESSGIRGKLSSLIGR
jgi:hypothetical protein